MTKKIEGKIIKIENTEEPPLIHIEDVNGKVWVYSIDDIEIVEQKGAEVIIAPFERDKA